MKNLIIECFTALIGGFIAAVLTYSYVKGEEPRKAPTPIPEPSNLELKYSMASFCGAKSTKRIKHEVLRYRRKKLEKK